MKRNGTYWVLRCGWWFCIEEKWAPWWINYVSTISDLRGVSPLVACLEWVARSGFVDSRDLDFPMAILLVCEFQMKPDLVVVGDYVAGVV